MPRAGSTPGHARRMPRTGSAPRWRSRRRRRQIRPGRARAWRVSSTSVIDAAASTALPRSSTAGAKRARMRVAAEAGRGHRRRKARIGQGGLLLRAAQFLLQVEHAPVVDRALGNQSQRRQQAKHRQGAARQPEAAGRRWRTPSLRAGSIQRARHSTTVSAITPATSIRWCCGAIPAARAAPPVMAPAMPPRLNMPCMPLINGLPPRSFELRGFGVDGDVEHAGHDAEHGQQGKQGIHTRQAPG